MTISDIETWLGVRSSWLVVPAAAVLFGAWIERIVSDHRRRRWRAGKRQFVRPQFPQLLRLATREPVSRAVFDGAEQLRIVERATFERRRLLNSSEARLLRVLEEACAAEAPDWRVMAQVSLGEILASPDAEAYRAINSKRVDLLLVGADGHARHAVEFQGSGHHIGPAATRDAVKKEALRRAGIGYVEVVPGDTPAELRAMVAKLVRRERSEPAA